MSSFSVKAALGSFIFLVAKAQDTVVDGLRDGEGCAVTFTAIDPRTGINTNYRALSLDPTGLGVTGGCINTLTGTRADALSCLYIDVLSDGSQPGAVFSCQYPATNGLLKKGTLATCDSSISPIPCPPWNGTGPTEPPPTEFKDQFGCTPGYRSYEPVQDLNKIYRNINTGLIGTAGTCSVPGSNAPVPALTCLYRNKWGDPTRSCIYPSVRNVVANGTLATCLSSDSPCPPWNQQPFKNTDSDEKCRLKVQRLGSFCDMVDIVSGSRTSLCTKDPTEVSTALNAIRDFILEQGQFDPAKAPRFNEFNIAVSSVFGIRFGDKLLVPEDEFALQVLELYRLGCNSKTVSVLGDLAPPDTSGASLVCTESWFNNDAFVDCDQARKVRSLSGKSAENLPYRFLPRDVNFCTQALSSLPTQRDCEFSQGTPDCSLTVNDYLEVGVTQADAQILVDTCPKLFNLRDSFDKACRLRQAVADLEPICSSGGDTTSKTSTTTQPYPTSNVTVYPTSNYDGSDCSTSTTELYSYAAIQTLPASLYPAVVISTSTEEDLKPPPNAVTNGTPGSPIQTVVVDGTPGSPIQTVVVDGTPGSPIQTVVVGGTPGSPIQTVVVDGTPDSPIQTVVTGGTPGSPIQPLVVGGTPDSSTGTIDAAGTPNSPSQTVVTFTGTGAEIRPVTFLLALGLLVFGI
ncbi:hypothetical protein VTL71DRAFT_1341 [Oculimacula yallundae]|uniref:Uncharacterized protein n=1 Tax=Oculimacula yallundae TaxID=86028 RepID=A0ABR4CBL1_9HELO